MDSRTISEKYAKIGEYLIENVGELSHLEGENIIYLSSTHAKKANRKKVLGQCEKVADKNKWAITCDFTITLFEPNLEGLSMEQIVLVIWHELLHVGVDDDNKWIEPHDLNDFKMIIEKFGVKWSVPGTMINDAVVLMAAAKGRTE